MNLLLPRNRDDRATFVERVEGSPLVLSIKGGAHLPMLLFPSASRITSLDIKCNVWSDIKKFSEGFVPRPPLDLVLDSLKLNVSEDDSLGTSSFLFGKAIYLKTFCINSGSPFLDLFRFPTLTSFKLSTTSARVFRGSQLLNFLTASPMLQKVRVEIMGSISLEGISEGRVVKLPCATKFTLIVSDGGPGYGLAAYLSCPVMESMSLTQKMRVGDMTMTQEVIFPGKTLWSRIVGPYEEAKDRRGVTLDEVALDMKTSPTTSCALSFLYSNNNVTKLNFEVSAGDGSAVPPTFDRVFTQATWSIRRHPHLVEVKRLSICHGISSANPAQISLIAEQSERLFRSLGSLDELQIHSCDGRPYLSDRNPRNPIGFLGIKKLIISQPEAFSDEQFVGAIEKLAISRRDAGVPRFECVRVESREGTKLTVGLERLAELELVGGVEPYQYPVSARRDV